MRLAALLVAALAAGPGCAAPPSDRLVLGTWNLEWLMTPETFDALAAGCLGEGRRAGGAVRAIPCNLVPAARWNAEDLARVADFAASVPADVVALQEVDGADAAARVFRDHDFCFTRRRHVQNVGFAVRRGIPHRCGRDVRALGLEEDDVRWGAELILHPGTRGEIRLLAVHLKSGCQRDSLAERRRECHMLQRQVPVLEDWIDRQAREGRAFAVLGDFNRAFEREPGVARNDAGETVSMWAELDDGEPPEADLLNPGADAGAFACLPEGRRRTAIDHLVLSRRLGAALVPDSWRAWPYPDRQRWPDHCLITVTLEREAGHGL